MSQLDTIAKQILDFFQKNEFRSFSPVFEKNTVTIEFEVQVSSYTAPGKKESPFSFILKLWQEKNNSVSKELRTKASSLVPFHPNFSRNQIFFSSNAQAVWTGYEKDEDIENYLKRMILSLQYHKDYLQIRRKEAIGNPKALRWYLETYHDDSTKFPTDQFKAEWNTNKQDADKRKFNLQLNDAGVSTRTKKKFIIEQEKTYSPIRRDMPELAVEYKLDSVTTTIESESAIYISPVARKVIFDHIAWGKTVTDHYRPEQGGILLGHVYQTGSGDKVIGIVEQAVAGESAKGSPVSLEMTHDTWSEMIIAADKLSSRENADELQVIGWYHTHPNDLDVFMSGTDRSTQKNFFNKHWHFAIVLNPQRKKWKAFSGKSAAECFGHFLKDETANE